MQARISGRQVASSTADTPLQGRSVGAIDLQTRADGESGRFCNAKLNTNPGCREGRIENEQLEGPAVVRDQHIRVPIVVDVTEGRPSGNPALGQGLADFGGDLREPTSPEIAVQEIGLVKGKDVASLSQDGIVLDGPVDYQDI